MTDTTTSLYEPDVQEYYQIKKEEWKNKLGNCFSNRQKKMIKYAMSWIIYYLQYYLSKFFAPFFTLVSYFMSIFVVQWKMSHKKFIKNIETNKKHVFHYLINNETRLNNISDEIEEIQNKRKHLLDFILTQYTCQQMHQRYNNNDFFLLNENVIFSDPLTILTNRKQFKTVFTALPILFQPKLDEHSIKVTHYNKCMVVSFDIEWYFFKNKASVKPQILIIVLNNNIENVNYQSDMQYIDDINILNENIKKEELTVYKTFPNNFIISKNDNESPLMQDKDQKQDEIIALYDCWMSDHHYAFFGYSKYIRKIFGFIFFVTCFILNAIVQQYNDFIKTLQQK